MAKRRWLLRRLALFKIQAASLLASIVLVWPANGIADEPVDPATLKSCDGAGPGHSEAVRYSAWLDKCADDWQRKLKPAVSPPCPKADEIQDLDGRIATCKQQCLSAKLYPRGARDAIAFAMRDHGGNRKAAARQLGTTTSTLLAKLRKYGLDEEGKG